MLLSWFVGLGKSAPVDSLEAYEEFLATRSAFVSQKKLFEYVKTRMGMSYPKMFEDAPFIASLNIAKWHVFGACMSDLSIWMGAQLHARGAAAEEVAEMSRHVFGQAARGRIPRSEFTGEIDALVQSFDNRVALADWSALSEGENAFRLSPEALVHWAPIADELKKYDVEIVMNSLRFAWLAIREEFRRKLNAEAVLEDWRRSPALRGDRSDSIRG